MNRTLWTSLCVVLLCGLVLTAGWAEKASKDTDRAAKERPNRPQAAQQDRPKPSPAAVSTTPYTRPTAARPSERVTPPTASYQPAKPTAVSTTPYTRPGANSPAGRVDPPAASYQPAKPTAVSTTPYTRPGANSPSGRVDPPAANFQPGNRTFGQTGPASNNRPPSGGDRPQGHPGDQGHPGQPNQGAGGHQIDDDHNNWSYGPHRPGEPDRAYPNQQWGDGDHHGDYHGDHDGHGGYGGYGPGYFDYGYSYPLPLYIPEPPIVVHEYEYLPAPEYIPAPRPRYGDGYAYYPQSYGPFTCPNSGDVDQLPLLGCEIIAADGTFLGVIDRIYDSPESIANRNSAYGNPESQVSIWNPDGPYGSPTAPYSPWNVNSYRPPVLYWHGKFRGYLTANPDLQPKISPALLPSRIGTSPWR